MKKTKAGLPNTCSVCGKPAGEYWYAEHDDAARAGLGVCEMCHGGEEAKSEKKGRRKKQVVDIVKD